MRRKGTFYFLSVALICILASREASGAQSVGYYTITLPTGTAVTMGDSSVTLPITVNNCQNGLFGCTSTSTDSIGYVRIDFDPNIYYVSNINELNEPTGWTATAVNNPGQGQSYIEYTTTTNKIPVGGSVTFNVTLTGSNNGNIPAVAQDLTDLIIDNDTSNCQQRTKTEMTIANANSNYFCRSSTGNADTWSRLSLYSSITASPSSVGIGGTITVIQTVTNRSSSAQTNVQPAIASMTLGNGLDNNGTGANATLTSGLTPASVASISSGASATFQWSYSATSTGSLRFCNSAKNGAGPPPTATSLTACSSYVSIGNFTASLSISPSQVVSGQNVTVTMTVTNNGSTTITNITPTLTPPGVATLVSGPTPASLGGLIPGESDIFQWVYTITGSVDAVFTFSGYATDNGGVRSTPDPAISNQGKISAYSVAVSPNNVCSGSANVTFTFNVRNKGGYPLQQILIGTPITAFVYNAAPSGGCATSWTVSTSGTPTKIKFKTASDYVPVNGSCNFSVRYSTIPTVTSNTDYNFRVDIWDTDTPTNQDPRASVGAIVKVTKNCMTLTATPGTLEPYCTAMVIATVTPNPCNPQDAVACPGSDPNQEGTVTFTATGGTLYDITKITKTSGGEAQATYKAPLYDASLTSVTITATFQDAVASTSISLIADDPSTPACSSTSYYRKIRWREVQ